jgi:GH25 family lysozyme M1 (1,4-beta-N-acetylmuramidase)
MKHPHARRLPARVEPLERRLLMARAVGIDVSNYQSTVNWSAVKANNRVFAWAKATEGLTFADAQFVNNMTHAKAAGVPIGGYHFARWDLHTGTAGASQEENAFWSVISPYVKSGGSYLVPMLDLENVTVSGVTYTPGNKGYTKATFSAWVNQFCADLVADAASAGVAITPVVYTGAAFAGSWLDSSVSQQWPGWLANYYFTDAQAQSTNGPPYGTSPWSTWQIWQYNDAGSSPGDQDVLNGDAAVVQNYVIGSQGRWADGTTVQVTASSVNVWNDATSNAAAPYNDAIVKQGGEPTGAVATVLSGPVYGNSYWRWQVRYKDGTVGWSAEDFLAPAAAPAAVTNSTPVNAATLTAKPTFTWSDTALATAYDVYLDGAVIASNLTPTVTTAGQTVTYTPATIPDGTHTWRVAAKNSAGTTLGPLASFTLDTTAPTATVAAAQSPTPGSPTFDFTVTYTDAVAVNAATFDDADVTVTGPNAFSQPARFVSATPAGSATSLVVTYRIDAPAGVWNLFANGTYTVTQNPGQVADPTNHARPAGPMGTFDAASPFAYVYNDTLAIWSSPANPAIAFSLSGPNFLASNGAAPARTFTPGAFSGVAYYGTTGDDTLTFDAAPGTPLTHFDAAGGSDALTLNTGPLSLVADLGPSVAVTLNNTATLTFSTSQQLRGLTLNGDSTATLTPGNKVLSTPTLQIAAGAQLDLADNDLVVDYATAASTPIDQIAAYLAAGYARGLWTGRGGIASSVAATTGNTTALAYAESATLPYTTVRGFPLDDTAVVVRYSWQGDANLDGRTDADDAAAMVLSAAQQQSAPTPPPTAPPARWSAGNFNYRAAVDADDLMLFSLGAASQTGRFFSETLATPATVLT